MIQEVVKEMYLVQGLNVPIISLKIGKRKSQVYRYLKSVGVIHSKEIENRKRNRIGLFTPDQDKGIANKYTIGKLSLNALAKEYGYIAGHRYKVAKHIKRCLLSTETVHHIDGNKGNNKVSNLQLRQGKHGQGVMYACADCGSHNIVEQELT